jgi:hypothetical protein
MADNVVGKSTDVIDLKAPSRCSPRARFGRDCGRKVATAGRSGSIRVSIVGLVIPRGFLA